MPKNPSNPKTKKLPPTLVTFVLDRSSSMSIIKDSTIEAFNGYLDGIRTQDNILFSLVQFDSHGGMQLEKVCVNAPAKAAPALTDKNFMPRGSTPLIDAAYTVIEAVEESLVGRPKDTKIVVCIQTDGEENCSREHTWEQLSALIKSKQEKGWEFNFMGAGIDAYQQGAKMGLSAAHTMSYDSSNLQATRSAFGARGMSTAMYASGATTDMTIGLAEKTAAGDKFDPSLSLTKVKQAIKANAPIFNLNDPTPIWEQAKKQDEKFKL